MDIKLDVLLRPELDSVWEPESEPDELGELDVPRFDVVDKPFKLDVMAVLELDVTRDVVDNPFKLDS